MKKTVRSSKGGHKSKKRFIQNRKKQRTQKRTMKGTHSQGSNRGRTSSFNKGSGFGNRSGSGFGNKNGKASKNLKRVKAPVTFSKNSAIVQAPTHKKERQLSKIEWKEKQKASKIIIEKQLEQSQPNQERIKQAIKGIRSRGLKQRINKKIKNSLSKNKMTNEE